MLQRVITGVVAIVAVIFLMFVRGILLDLVVVAVIIGAIWEEYSAFRHGGHEPVTWPGLVAAALLIPAYRIFGTGSLLALTIFSTMLVMLVVCCRKQPEWIDGVISVYTIYTVFLPLSMMFVLIHASQPGGIQLLALVFILAIGGDTFAYFTGVIFGKHKLCPAVSPNKTVEGAVGGLAASMLLGMAYVGALNLLGYTIFNTWSMLVLCLLGGVAGQIGDLAASLIKRHCGIKDFGHIFPGHGGIMDRIDSILFTLMVVCSYAILFWKQ